MSKILNYKKIIEKNQANISANPNPNPNPNPNQNQDQTKTTQLSQQKQEQEQINSNESKYFDYLNANTNPNTNPNTTFDANTKDFKTWANFFHTNGFIILNGALDSDVISGLKSDLKNAEKKLTYKKTTSDRHNVHKCFFENSPKTVDLIESSILVDFAQYLIADVPGARGNTLSAHLIHNNAFSVPPGGRGQAPTFHTDDCLQNVIIPDGKKLPDWIKLPVMVVTWMCWLSDCSDPANGPTWVVPGSHRFGRTVDSFLAEQMAIPACGKAGTCVLINNQIWHRGSSNTSDIPRDTLQLTFARRIIGHKHKTIMNYNMPTHVYLNKSDKVKERFGFLQGGAYS